MYLSAHAFLWTLLIIPFSIPVLALSEQDLPWTYICQDGFCERVPYSRTSNEPKVSMQVCRLTCSRDRTLWPSINGRSSLSNDVYRFCVKGEITLSLKSFVSAADRTFLDFQFRQFRRRKDLLCTFPEPFVNNTIPTHFNESPVKPAMMTITIKLLSVSGRTSTLETDESYRLKVDTSDIDVNIRIEAPNRYGARHGLATLNQLMVNDPLYNCIATLTQVTISDSPQYQYRGVHIDTSRNFLSIDNIKSLIEVMSMFKMNTLHFHITDSHSFPYDTPAQPEMAEHGAYRKKWTYTRDQMADLTAYADMQGIRVMPEIDMPAHTGYGWQWGEAAGLGKLVLCEGISPYESFCLQAPCGQLNIINPNVYSVLETILSDLYNVTNTQMFHMGGDEVKFECWNATNEIIKYMLDTG